MRDAKIFKALKDKKWSLAHKLGNTRKSSSGFTNTDLVRMARRYHKKSTIATMKSYLDKKYPKYKTKKSFRRMKSSQHKRSRKYKN